CGVAYFTSRTRELVKKRYEGTLLEIEKRGYEYRKIYYDSLIFTVLTAIGLTLVIACVGYLYFSREVFLIIITIASGCVYLVVILLNASVLPLFGKTVISTLAMSIVIIFELASIPFAMQISWYAAAGFLVGNAVGFTVSLCYTTRLLREFELNLFRFLLFKSNK
ncbi:MAG: hypothetical protein NUV31_10500, partial [Dehalococcoidales bacterium]|nr:hypothetical protein [Dehalococcoidales bacterium]